MLHLALESQNRGVWRLGIFVVGIAGQHFFGVFQIVLKVHQPLDAFLGQVHRFDDVLARVLGNGDGRGPGHAAGIFQGGVFQAHHQEHRAHLALAKEGRFDVAGVHHQLVAFEHFDDLELGFTGFSLVEIAAGVVVGRGGQLRELGDQGDVVRADLLAEGQRRGTWTEGAGLGRDQKAH